MRIRTIALAALWIGLMLLPATSHAGCYSCGTDECCKEASRNSSGKDICRHSVLFVGSGQSCHDCLTSGSYCVGTAEPECDNTFDICEEHRTMLVVPHGQTIDLLLMTRPPVLQERESATPAGAIACAAV